MKNLAKPAGKIALGAGIGYLAMGELIYEYVLNIDLKDKIDSTGIFKDEEKEKWWSQCTLSNEANEWYDNLHIGNTVLQSDRLKRETYAKVFFNDKKTDKWIITVHGYTDTPRKMAHWIKTYLDMGYNVCSPFMVGHGPDKSHYTSMGYYDRFVVLDWIDYIVSINKNAVIGIHGVSMGAATTMMVTGEVLPDNVKVAVEDCGYTSCWDEYCSQVGPMFHLPAVPVVTAANIVSKARGNFDFKEASPIKAVVHSKTPTLFIHGENDTFVPYRMMAPLYEACGAPDKKMLSIPEATHATAVYYDNELYWNTVKEFIGKYLVEEKPEEPAEKAPEKKAPAKKPAAKKAAAKKPAKEAE